MLNKNGEIVSRNLRNGVPTWIFYTERICKLFKYSVCNYFIYTHRIKLVLSTLKYYLQQKQKLADNIMYFEKMLFHSIGLRYMAFNIISRFYCGMISLIENIFLLSVLMLFSVLTDNEIIVGGQSS